MKAVSEEIYGKSTQGT